MRVSRKPSARKQLTIKDLFQSTLQDSDRITFSEIKVDPEELILVITDESIHLTSCVSKSLTGINNANNSSAQFYYAGPKYDRVQKRRLFAYADRILPPKYVYSRRDRLDLYLEDRHFSHILEPVYFEVEPDPERWSPATETDLGRQVLIVGFADVIEVGTLKYISHAGDIEVSFNSGEDRRYRSYTYKEALHVPEEVVSRILAVN